MVKRLVVALANGLGLGLSPVASGTVGSLWGLLLVWLLHRSLPGRAGYLMGAAVLVVLAIPICEIAEKYYGKKDDGRIVADEYMTFPVCMIGLSLSPASLVVAFLSNRFFDILKPWPAFRLQNLHGGVGIVVDDLIACCYSLAANHLVLWVLRRYLNIG